MLDDRDVAPWFLGADWMQGDEERAEQLQYEQYGYSQPEEDNDSEVF